MPNTTYHYDRTTRRPGATLWAKAAILLVIAIVLGSLLAGCIGGGGGPEPTATTSDDWVTATFGAEQYHQQLTAIAPQSAPPLLVPECANVIHPERNAECFR